MALETGTYISDLVSTNPAGTDTLDKADDHLRLIKSTVKATFPNITGAVTPTQTDLNKLTSAGSPQFSTIELGAASDTTISRVSAGLIAVEGGNVPLENRANTFSANQIISVTDNTNAALRVTQLGTGLALRIEDETNPDSTPVVVDASGNVGVGTTSPDGKLDVAGTSGTLQFKAGTDANGYFGVTAFDSNPVYCLVAGANATLAAFGAQTNIPMSFLVNNSEAARIDTSKNLLLTSTGALGYGTGSGGTVTQITSKSTGVTLNKTNGTIVTHNAALLGSGNAVTFVVTNSTVAATDTVIVHRASGGTAGAYIAHVDAVAAGSFTVALRNFSGGSLSEALTLNFAVIKAVTS